MAGFASLSPHREDSTDSAARPPLAYGVLLGLSGAKLLIHLLLSGRYGYFRDELYFLDCGRHLAWGYVDHAPMVALFAKIGLLLGGSLPAIRFFPILAGALVVALTVLMARELGGGRFAQGLAGLCVLVAPVNLGIGSILSMNAFEPLWWMGCIYLLIRIVRTGDSRFWIWFGVLAGLGLMTKHSTFFFGLAVIAGLLLTAQRRELRKPWIWAGGAIAVLIFLPNVLWQMQHHFATLDDLYSVQKQGKNVALGPLAFVTQQILMLHPIVFPVWLAGLVSFLVGRNARFRVLGWTYLILLVMMMALRGKNYYLAPIYPMLFASGGAAVERWFNHRSWAAQRLWPKAALVTGIAILAAVIDVLALPLLPPDMFLAYQRALGLRSPKTEVHHAGPLPQLFGDQFGWPELTADVAKVYRSLTPEERARTAILAGNYGEAGALNLFGPNYGLPTALSAHQTHYLWGPRGFTGDTLILLQANRSRWEQRCRSVDVAATHFHPYGMAEENEPILVCRGLQIPLADLWPRLKHWN